MVTTTMQNPAAAAPQSLPAMVRQFLHAVRYALGLIWQTSPRYVLGLLVTTLLSAPGPAVQLYISKLIIDTVARAVTTGAPASATTLIVLILAQLIVLLFSNVMQQLNTMFGTLLGEAFLPGLTDRILAKSNELDLAFFENAEYYDALQRASQEARFQPVQVLQNLIYLAQGAFGLISFLVILSGFSAWAIVGLLIGAAVALITQARASLFEYLTLDYRVPAIRRLMYLFQLLTQFDSAKEVRLFDLGERLRRELLFAQHRDVF